jgi:hypothetical protein
MPLIAFFHCRYQRFRIDGSYRNRNHIRGVWIEDLRREIVSFDLKAGTQLNFHSKEINQNIV